MTHTEMLKTMIACSENLLEANKKYVAHPGGGASQKNKNRLARELRTAYSELSNATFNIKQFLK